MDQFGCSISLAVLLLMVVTIQTTTKDNFSYCLEEETCKKINGKAKFHECSRKLHVVDYQNIINFALEWFKKKQMVDKSLESLSWETGIDIGCNDTGKTKQLVEEYYNQKVSGNKKAHDNRAEFDSRTCLMQMVDRCLMKKSFSMLVGK